MKVRGTTNRNKRGNTRDREARRARLCVRYESDKGPGTCRCYRCGSVLYLDGERALLEVPTTEDGVTYHHSISIDRIIPGSEGGKYTDDNIRPACLSCNMIRGNR
jgi:hypothetical protein